MALVFGCIVPHPPIMVPEVGGGQERRVSATLAAMDRLAHALASSCPDELWLISPHGISYSNAMGIATAPASEGSLREWGPRCAGLDYRFENDSQAVATIQRAAGEAGIPLRSTGEHRYELDHGVLVPLYFLTKALPKLPLVSLTFSWLPLKTHYEYGQALGQAAQSLPKRIALVASGDLSHRLLPSAPAGYDPQGAVFDKRLVELVAAQDSQGILALDPELIERAGECGLRSITILLGAVHGLPTTPQVLSYEGPFGVGYLVAAFPVGGAGPAPGPEAAEAAPA
ncbi:MAG: AmmeMemoRadiSam system protein B, partial [Chloroflexi bacterium]|nr:AmmeMemoRadiSam system protein B [Chloroflexota bacterium]